MKTIRRLFREVRIETTKVAFLQSFLNSCLLFFALYLALLFFNLGLMYALVPTGVFLIGDFIYWKKKLNLKAFEDCNPEVKEMLRTAHDNQDQKNVLTLGLFYDLVKNMKKVSAGNMLDSKNLFRKVLAITLLTFVVVFISSLEIYIGNIQVPVQDVTDNFGSVFEGNESEAGDAKNQTLEEIGFNQSSNLYGDKSLAKLGDDKMDLTLNPSTSQMDFEDEKNLEDKDFEKNSYPVEAEAQSSDFSEEDVPEEAELAKTYNLELKNE